MEEITMKNEELTLNKCCLCGHTFPYEGYNPWPIVKEKGAVCCEYCFDYWVMLEHEIRAEENAANADYGD